MKPIVTSRSSYHTFSQFDIYRITRIFSPKLSINQYCTTTIYVRYFLGYSGLYHMLTPSYIGFYELQWSIRLFCPYWYSYSILLRNSVLEIFWYTVTIILCWHLCWQFFWVSCSDQFLMSKFYVVDFYELGFYNLVWLFIFPTILILHTNSPWNICICSYQCT